jgi:hypothetical protein
VSATVRLRRAHNGAEVIALAEPYEPRTTVLLDPVIERRLGRGVRAWVAELPDGQVGGVLVVFRLCRDRWCAAPLVLDDRAASAVARAVDRSPAFQLIGTTGNVAPVLPHLRRAGTVVEMPYTALSASGETLSKLNLAPEDGTRIASPADLDELIGVYREYELDFFTTEPRLRTHLRGALRQRRIAVVERDGRIVGAFRAEWVSRKFMHWGGLTVLPEYRGDQLSWPVQLRAMVASAFANFGVSFTRHPANPLPRTPVLIEEVVPPELNPIRDTWLQVRLRPRLRGIGRLHKALERLEGRLTPRPRPIVDASRQQAAAGRSEARRKDLGLDRLTDPRAAADAVDDAPRR